MEDNLREIVLQRSENYGFGFSIIGGAGSDLPPLIFDIVENSPADKSASIETGDTLVRVNGLDVQRYTTKQVLKTLRLSGPELTLQLRRDAAIKQRVDKYLFCSSEDAGSLRDAITQKDLTGVDELIVTCHGSPRPAPRSQHSKPNDCPLLSDFSPDMPRKMDEDGVKGKPRHSASRIPAPKSGIPAPKSGIPTPKSGKFHPKNMENGFEKGDASGTHKVSSQSAGGFAQTKDGRRLFETFVMTGDMIIQTTSPHHKPDLGSQGSLSEKRSIEVKGSPVPLKKERRTSIDKNTDAKKVTNQKPPAAAASSPKASPKIVENSAPEPESPKLSPKKDSSKKSPAKQSRLPRLGTPKGSPKSSPKVSPKRVQKSETELTSTIQYSGDMDIISVSVIENSKERATNDYINANNQQNGGSPVRPSQLEMRPQELELLGYTRYPDVPVELDIPPDDISSEDEKYKNECVVDVDDLPPPPEEFFQADSSVATNQEPLPPAPVHLGSPLPMDLNDDHAIRPILNGLIHSKDLMPSQLSPVRESQEILGFDAEDILENGHDIMVSGTCKSSISESMSNSLPKVHGHSRCASLGEHSTTAELDNHSTCSDSKLEQCQYRNSPVRSIVVSKSAEKIAPSKQATSPNQGIAMTNVVRSSKSHENRLETNELISFVDIDLDENLASSVDALHYEQSTASLDSLGYVQFSVDQARSLDSSPDKRSDNKGTKERVFMPTFINLEEPRSIAKGKEGSKLRGPSKGRGSAESSPSRSQSSPSKEPNNVSEDKARSPQTSSPSHTKPSAIPVRDSNRKPPRPPIRSASNVKSPTSSESPPKSGSNNPSTASPDTPSTTSPDTPSTTSPDNPTYTARSPTSRSQETTVVDESTEPLPASPSPSPTVIESPVRSAQSHVVQTDLPTEDEAPIATSSAPPSPVGDGPGGDIPHHDLLGEKNGMYHQPQKDIDRPSAQRLAKRLFHLDGFKKNDVTRHLSKKNDFAFLIGEEFLKFFNFEGQTLDQALRGFLKNVVLAGETQERERVLAHFSRRYMETSPGNFNSEDSCHTLVCAMMLLNTDLHGQNIGRKMTVAEFVENLAELNDGENYPREVLKNLHHSIRTEPLECQFEDDHDDSESGVSGSRSQDQQRHLGFNPFLDLPDPSKATEFKKGYVMRKCCIEPDGRKTAMGKRGWKMFYATLRDMVLYLHKDDHAFKKGTSAPNMMNAIRIHHSLAYRATDYKKKQHVFRLQTSDWAQYLFQTSNSKECQDWIDKINFVTATFSAPPLPGGVGSQRKFQRPLMPATYTKLNLREQALQHEQRVLQMEQDLHDHRKYPPEKGVKSRVIQDYVEKEAYLQFEYKRFKVYSAMIQMKLATYPELEPSLVEVTIGEVDEPVSLPSSPEQQRVALPSADPPAEDPRPPGSPSHTRPNKPVQRSMSDRPQSAVTRIPMGSRSPSMLHRHHLSPPHRHSMLPTAAYETQV